MINGGHFKPGDRLPNIEELSRQLGVGRSSLREGLKGLQQLGLITVRHGGGTFVTEFIPGPHPHYSLLRDLAEVRRMVEVYASGLAAVRATDEQLARLAETLEQMQRSIHSALRFIHVDREFHMLVAQATQNPIIPNILASVEPMFEQMQEAIVFLPGSRQKALNWHHKILDALRARNPAAARRYMSLHLDSAVRQLESLPREVKDKEGSR